MTTLIFVALISALISALTADPNAALLALQERCRTAGGVADVIPATLTGPDGQGSMRTIPAYILRCTREEGQG